MNSAAGSIDARRRRQLPAEVSAFIGRADELTTLAGLLASARLVTVAGPGGVGKTRLALRAAAAAAGGFPDGVCLVDLSSLTDEGLLAATVARRLRLRGNDPRAAILSYLRGQRLLLILDTCEHLVAACARFAAQVLREAAGVTLLATSRQPLHIAGERVLRLGPIPLPLAGGARVPGDAVELFATRAAAALPGFTVTAAAQPDVIRLCRRLDGIPLALELAAVRVRALPLAELAERLESTFSLLAGARRGLVPRQRTLQAAIEWSYELCTVAERAVWDRLSVFPGSFDLAVAQPVAACAQVPAGQVGGVLASLADKSVVLPAGGGRYRLLGSVREFAAERLARAGQEADCRRRHAGQYLDLARDFGRQLEADDQPARLARLRAEHANIRAALTYGFAVGGNDSDAETDTDTDADTDTDTDAETVRGAAHLAGALLPYWLMSGTLREGLRWQDKALARFAAPSPERASALANGAILGALLGRPNAVTDAREAIAMAAGAGDARTRARGYLALQLALGLSGAYPQALEAAGQARRELDALGAETAQRYLEVQLAQTHQLGGDFAAAMDACQRTLAVLGPGERWLRGWLHIISALALYRQPGCQAECARAATAGRHALRDLDDLLGEAHALELFGWLAADDGRFERAAWLLGAAQALWERAGGRLSGSAVLEGYHSRSVSSARSALGAGGYAELHARGAARPPGPIAMLDVGGTDPLPGVPGPRAERDNAVGARPDGPAGPDGPGADGLTGRERQIAALVASGLSNREIAVRLVISQRTVDAHVNHIFAKLDISSRVQLTRRLSKRVALT